jgi:very-short-patch-repair endonuclease
MDPVEALRELGGVAPFGELITLTSRKEIVAALKDGRIHKPRHNRYCLADVEDTMRAVARTGGTASHLSAAQEFGWKLKHEPLRPCITLPRSARKPAGSYELHWADLSDRERRRNVTSRTRTVIDCARAYDFDVALSVADSALREGVVDQDDLLLAAARSPRTGRAKAVRVAREASRLRANPFETCLYVIATTVLGLSVVPQGEVPGVGFVDLLDRLLGIVIEAESLEHHWTKAGLQRDVDRYTKAARLGLVVLRFTWTEVMYSPDQVALAIEDVVRWRTKQAVGGHGLVA